jgi:ferric-dicitrate binding protein FerR (iron transport regulator)
LLVKYLLKETNEQEQEAVRNWLDADGANRRHFDELSKIWHKSRELAESSEVDVNAAWNRFRSRVQVKQTTKPAAPGIIRRIWRAAAVILLLLATGASAWWWMNREPAVEMISFATQNQALSDTLPDGSVVALNKGSKLQYPSRFEKSQRAVELDGEGFFAVEPDASRPFLIKAGDVTIQVLGTSFNVKELNGSVEVVVETGKVKVEKDGKSLTLTAGEKVIVSDSADWTNAPLPQEDKLYQYYRTRSFVCDNTPLWRLADVLQEAYGIEIVFVNPAHRDLRWDVTIENESLEQVLNLIQATFDIKIVREDNRVLFR